MSDKLHLLIPDAAPPPGMLPPHLRALLSALAPAGRIVCDDDSPDMPFERALALANGLPGAPGHVPWAAFETGTVGPACAWIRLCHLRVGMDSVEMAPPDALDVDADTARALWTAMAPYFAEDGIALEPPGGVPGSFLAIGEAFRDLATVSADRAVGRRLTPASSGGSGPHAARLRRLQNEMQMLLYTHPANDARQARGLLPINSFWVGGAGALGEAVPVATDVRVEPLLYRATRQPDAGAREAAWAAVDAGSCAHLLERLRAGLEVRLTLCGEFAAQTWGPVRSGALARLSARLRGDAAQRQALEALNAPPSP